MSIAFGKLKTFADLQIIAKFYSVALSLRRPNLLQFTAYMVDCVRSMENNPHAPPADIDLVAYVKLLNMAEEINSIYALADKARPMPLTENDSQQLAVRFEKRLAHWRETCGHMSLNGKLKCLRTH